MIRRLKLGLDFRGGDPLPVGEMLVAQNGVIYLQLAPSFLELQMALSPFKVKAISEPQTPSLAEASLFDGLFGVCGDSLPDGWGLLMMSRGMRKAGLDFSASHALDKLAFVGNRGMGALVYEPATENQFTRHHSIDLAALGAEADRVLQGKSEDILSELMALGVSPGGARPKVLVGVEKNQKDPLLVSGVDQLPANYEHWIIKFKGKDESPDAGIVEYIYSKTAAQVGISIPETKIFTDNLKQNWFGVKRFDRAPGNRRLHMHSVAGLLHANFRLPTLDYEDLLKLTSAITRREDDLHSMFRIAVFNILFHNRDDHSKNFSFLMSESGEWRLAPAYDLTWSRGPGGEHTTAVLGEGKTPTKSHLIALAERRGIDRGTAQKIISQVEAGKQVMLDLLRQHGIKSHPVLESLKSSA